MIVEGDKWAGRTIVPADWQASGPIKPLAGTTILIQWRREEALP
jgi:hypothetical protein